MKICANCGTEFEDDEWHPVTTETDQDGILQIHSFCCQQCHDEWVSGG